MVSPPPSSLIESGHTAVICGSDLMALGAVRAARSRGLQVPDDLSVVGFDDSPLIAFTDPPLTTIRQPVAAMGHAAVAALVAEIRSTPVSRAEPAVPAGAWSCAAPPALRPPVPWCSPDPGPPQSDDGSRRPVPPAPLHLTARAVTSCAVAS